jgi:polysaccharide biosynthesis/export protein
MLKKILPALIAVISLTGCFNSSIMLKTPKDFKYSDPKTSSHTSEYRISPNDEIDFRIFTNDGFKLVDLTTLSSEGGAGGNAAAARNTRMTQQYIVEHDGVMKLPIIGRVPLAGMTIREAERYLEEQYTTYYIKPFILMNVSNRRVMVYPGDPGNARVVALNNNNTTLIEALALAGGISRIGKAKRIKLIRGDLNNPQVFLIDLSTIEGMKQADLVLQANDIIYVEPRLRITQGIVSELAPVVSIVTSVLFFWFTYNRLN